jgi:hypothetical protein
MHREQLPKAGDIFKRGNHYASVMQDKKPPRRLYAGVWQPVTARETGKTASSQSHTRKNGAVVPKEMAVNRQTASTPVDNFQKHHGSETRQLSLVAGRIGSFR